MSFTNIDIIQVYFVSGQDKLIVGRLASKQRRILFEYDTSFIQTGIELSPFKLPLKSGVKMNEDGLFDGLFGVFNDSLPDGWGRLLLDRKLRGLGVNPGDLSPLDRLRYVGAEGMGALVYMPEIEVTQSDQHQDLDEIAQEIDAVIESDDDQFIDDLLAMNGSSAGARPKIMTRIGDEDWVIKFCSSVDPKDVGAIEYAYHLMAKSAGLQLPEAKLFPSKQGQGYFGVKRFDRKEGERLHMHSLSGLIHADHRFPSLDYETVMKATAWLTKDVRETEKQFRNAVFNVLSHNRDDHAKNFSFLMDRQGQWCVSPAYDLTFSSGPSGEHSTMVMGEGRNPAMTHLLALAQCVDIKKQKALEIIDAVRAAVSKWKNFSDQAGVSQGSFSLIQTAISDIEKKLKYKNL